MMHSDVLKRRKEDLEQKFLMLIDENKRVIYKVCMMYATEQEPLEDLYQEVVLNLWKGFPKFQGGSKQSTWLYRVAMNTCISFIRRLSVRPPTIPITYSMESLFADETDNLERIRELYRHIGKLGKLERALVLLWLDERSYEEIGEILGISPTNVGVRLGRVKTKLRTMFNK